MHHVAANFGVIKVGPGICNCYCPTLINIELVSFRLKTKTNGGKMKLLNGLLLVTAVALVSSCGGGGGSSKPDQYDNSSDVVAYPYKTVYGDVCRTSEPTPGCTFSRQTGQRITVSADPDYDQYGYGSDDMWYVTFDSSGNANVYDDLGTFQYTAQASDFAGYIGGTTIGVGTSGYYWENVSNGTYWFGDNGVLYSANTMNSNYGQAINNKGAKNATDVNSKAIASEANKKLIKAGADKLMKEYKLPQNKAVAVASALNSWAVMGAERGKVTTSDMDKTFRTVFGVKFSEALSTVNAFRSGDPSASDKARDLTNRTANNLGIKPDQAKDFIKGMYKGAIEDAGMSVDDIQW